MRRSACLEMLFADEPVFAARVGRAKAAGFDAVEFWRWRNKDIDALEAACRDSGLPVAGFLTEPTLHLTDPAQRDGFLEGLGQSLDLALRLDARLLLTQGGHPAAGMSHAAMVDAICEGLDAAADMLSGTGVTLVLEPVSDNPGCFLADSALGFDIIERVNRPEARLLYDLYHAAVLGEDWRAALPRLHLAGHIHVADHPGRGAPGTGTLPVAAFLSAVAATGYDGMIGYEYR